jgi:hypothetical protein
MAWTAAFAWGVGSVRFLGLVEVVPRQEGDEENLSVSKEMRQREKMREGKRIFGCVYVCVCVCVCVCVRERERERERDCVKGGGGTSSQPFEGMPLGLGFRV